MTETTIPVQASRRPYLRPIALWILSMLLTPLAVATFLLAGIFRYAETPPLEFAIFGRVLGMLIAFIAFSLPVLPANPAWPKWASYAYRGVGILVALPGIILALLSSNLEVWSQFGDILIASLVGALLTQWMVVRREDLIVPKWLLWMEGLRVALLGNMLFIVGMLYTLLPVLQIAITEH